MARTPALNQVTKASLLWKTGAVLSFAECAPKRPPRVQKFPLASGTLKFDTTIGRDSTVASTKNTIWRVSRSWHSLTSDSLTIMTMSRMPPARSLANSAIFTLPSGMAVCAPLSGSRSRRPISGYFRFSAVGCLRAVQQFLAVDDLQHAALVGAIGEIDAVALRPRRERAMQFGRHRSGGAGLLSGQAELSDLSSASPDRSGRRPRSFAGCASFPDRRPGRRCRSRIPTSSCGCPCRSAGA